MDLRLQNGLEAFTGVKGEVPRFHSFTIGELKQKREN